MQIIKRGYILPEEKQTYNKLNQLPDNWWCISGSENRFILNKTGVQIDFIIICPKGIFLIESKNVSTIELKEGNKIRFLNSEKKEIKRSEKHSNPVEEIIEIRYKLKDWLQKRNIESLIEQQNKILNVFIHGLVVISNESKVKYQNCNINNLSYTKHKYPTLLELSKLNENFFNNFNLPQKCKILDKEKMLLLFKLLYSPNMTISQILSETYKEKAKSFEEKQIFIEKLKLLETENISLNKKSIELENTRNNLLSLNQNYEIKIKNLKEKETKNLEEINSYKKTEKSLKEKIKNLLSKKEKETKEYKNSKEIQKKNNKQKKIAIILTAILLTSILANLTLLLNSKGKNVKKSQNTNIFSQITKIENYFKEKKYQKIKNLWEKKINKNKKINLNSYIKANKLPYYLAISYQKIKMHQKAIKHFNESLKLLNQKPKYLVKTYFLKSISQIELKTNLKQSIKELNQALKISQNKLKNKYKWKSQILWNLALINKMIYFQKDKESKSENSNKSIDKNKYLKESIKNYKKIAELAKSKKDILLQANVNYELGHLNLNNQNYNQALKYYNKSSRLLELISPNKKIFEKLLLLNHEIALILAEQKNYKQAEEYFKIIINLCQDKNNVLPKANKINLSAQFYFSLASMLEEKKDLIQALKNYKKGKKIASEFSSKTLQEKYNKKIKNIEKKLYKP